MNENEQIEHELIKNTLKLAIMNNRNLSSFQKQQAVSNIDKAAQQADWIIELIKRCGYIE